MNILFAASEVFPFAKTGGLADVTAALPKELNKKNTDCRIVLPLYGFIAEEYKKQMKFIKSIFVPLSWRNQYLGIFEAKINGVICYFIDNEYYFKRDWIYGYYDDAERFAFFSRAVLCILPHINFTPDVIHCHDWQTGAVPLFLSEFYKNDPFYQNIKTVFTIHNIEYQGSFDMFISGDVLGLPSERQNLSEYGGRANFMKMGILCADRITTVSTSYAAEIQNPYFSCGLDGILTPESYKLSGIINGIDTEIYNPRTDNKIITNYSFDNLSKKRDNKEALEEIFNLDVCEESPIVAMVTRLAEHKGIDLVMCVFDELINEGIRFCILGAGEKRYEDFFREKAEKYKGRVGVRLGFDDVLAHRIYAGADIFLMPSRSEPCGLSQLIALRYGAVPVVRETGGLNDTVTDSGLGLGNGYTFKNYNAHDMKNAVLRAVSGYRDKKGHEILTKRAMQCDNGWSNSAEKYIKLYKDLCR